MSKFLKLVFAVFLTTSPAIADGIGRNATPDEIFAWDIDIRPDGTGLPDGSGSVFEGEAVFEDQCADCHGDFGEGIDRWPILSGGFDTLTSERPVKTIGSYWPYLSTVWDYIYRAMPFGNAQSLEANEVYALTAYLMYLNDIVADEGFRLSKTNFLAIPLGNEANFYPDNRDTTEYPYFNDACMSDCKTTVEITKYASGKDVTPN